MTFNIGTFCTMTFNRRTFDKMPFSKATFNEIAKEHKELKSNEDKQVTLNIPLSII